CFFLLVAGVAAAVSRKTHWPLLAAGVLIATIGAGVIANVSPSLLYRLRNGSNASIIDRGCGESEAFGLKIAQMLLPISGHRVAQLARLKTEYVSGRAPIINENDTASLGLIGSIGFLVLVGGFLLRRSPSRIPLLELLGVLSVAAVLLATVGGFGTLFAVAGGRWIRAYNRISVYIAFFALLAVALFASELYRRFGHTRRAGIAFNLLVVLGTAVGILDQTSVHFALSYAATKEAYQAEAEFVRAIEASVPLGGMVFQLPYLPFPESPPMNQMGDYDLFRGYLHSRNLRWSYGHMKGREGDQWHQTVAGLPPEEMVRTLALAGFDGLTIDRFAYADQAAALEADFARLL